jgi:hypothetical protein
MPSYHFERESRTSDSEVFSVLDGTNEVARADIHFGLDVVRATLCVPETFSEDDIQDLISEIDERLVLTGHPYREDFIVTVWLGRLAGVYSEEFEEELDEDVDGNGHRG